jgi:hypothetical protein
MPVLQKNIAIRIDKPVASSKPQNEAVQKASALVGCLLDVSNSMKEAMETKENDKRAIDRLRAILRATLKLARAEQHHNPNALMFLGAFGMENDKTPVVDLCGLLDGLLESNLDTIGHRSGHDRLVVLANEQNVPHVTKYIRTRLTEHEARIVHLHLRKRKERIPEFVATIPSAENLDSMETTANVGVAACMGGGVGLAVAMASGPFAPLVLFTGAAVSLGSGMAATKAVKDKAVDNSDAMKLAKRICAE